MAPKTFDILRYLVEHAGRLVPQEELIEAIWPQTYVQPEILRKYILAIRRVLEDPPRNPIFIETQPKRGYRFIAQVLSESQSPANGNYLAQLTASDANGRLVGRESSLGDLAASLKSALRGQRQVIFVTGEPGIGKTTLVDLFQQRGALNSETRIARGQCVEGFGGKETYYPMLEAMSQLLRGPGGAEVVRTLAAHAPTWLAQFPSAMTPDQRSTIQREILGATRERMVRELCEAIEAISAENPLILLLEDLQWVDDSTLDLISALARRRGPAKLVLLGTYRPVDLILSRSPLRGLKHDLLIHRLCQEVALERLTEREVKQFLDSEFPATGLPEVLSRLVHRHSDGNPLFMMAVLEQLREKGLVVKERGQWVLTVPPERADPGVPETLRQMLEVQLERLDAAEQRVLRAASVVGLRFSAWAVAAVQEDDPDQIEETLETLASGHNLLKRGGLLELSDGSASALYEFKHTLYREVLYKQIPPAQRRQLHLRLAARMEGLCSPPDPVIAAELALHFEEGRDYERAVRYLMVTADTAASRHAHADALSLLGRALEQLPQIASVHARKLEIELLERVSDALYAQGEMAQSVEIDHQVAELASQAGHKPAQVNALTRMARSLAFLDSDRCNVVCQRAVEISRTHDDPLLQARAEMLAACWRIVTNGWRKDDAALCAAARAQIRSLSDEVPAYYEILYAHVQCTEGDYEGACRTARAAIPKSLETGNLVVYLSSHSSLAYALQHLGRWGELVDVSNAAIDAARKNGNAPWVGIFEAGLAWLHLQAGDFDGARHRARDLMQDFNEDPPGQIQTSAMVTAGFAEVEAGDCGRALELFAAVSGRETHPRFFFDWYWRMMARLGSSRAWLAMGDKAKARREANLFLEAALNTADPALKGLAWEMKARITLAEGYVEPARDWVKNALEQSAGIPAVAWKCLSTAAEFSAFAGDAETAATHRSAAAAVVLGIADSFASGDPMRETLLDSREVRHVLG
jgi:DNA-binding winged helix-turn-helix (wHTH) protein/tetratricopeptide (TPR) repeat protein